MIYCKQNGGEVKKMLEKIKRIGSREKKMILAAADGIVSFAVGFCCVSMQHLLIGRRIPGAMCFLFCSVQSCLLPFFGS